jgi:hypothetical protein
VGSEVGGSSTVARACSALVLSPTKLSPRLFVRPRAARPGTAYAVWMTGADRAMPTCRTRLRWRGNEGSGHVRAARR